MNVYSVCAKSYLPLIIVNLAQAEEQAPVLMQTSPLASGGKVLLFLILVVGLILGLAWLVNKTRVGQFASQGQHLKALAMLPLGQREKVAIIQAGNQQLVIGVTPNGITTLATLDQPLPETHQKPTDFADILRKAVRK